MQETGDVERTLAVIRRLMERGQEYEAISGRGALLAGVTALLASAALAVLAPAGGVTFLLTWLCVATACLAWTAWTALARARQPGGSRISAQAVAVGLAVLPAYLSAVVLTLVLWRVGRADLLPATWLLMHGTAILATWHHAPRRLVGLGVAHLVAGASLALLAAAGAGLPSPNLAMALGFGGINVAYGALVVVWPAAGRD